MNENTENAEFGEVLNQLLDLMQSLPIPLPPHFEAAAAYPGRSRFVALFWGADGGDLMYDDGRLLGYGYGPAWQVLMEHPRVGPFVNGLHFGSMGHEAELYFIVDRVTRQAYAGDLIPTMRLLFFQQTHELTVTNKDGQSAPENLSENSSSPTDELLTSLHMSVISSVPEAEQSMPISDEENDDSTRAKHLLPDALRAAAERRWKQAQTHLEAMQRWLDSPPETPDITAD